MVALLIVSVAPPLAAQPDRDAATTAYFDHWPPAADPYTVGKLLGENVVSRSKFSGGGRKNTMYYCEAATYYGAMRFARTAGFEGLENRLLNRMEWVIHTIPGRKYMPWDFHVDSYVFGSVPLQMYLLTGNETYRRIGLDYADRQWEDPDEQGLTRQARFWVDDIYMVCSMQVQAYRATGQVKYVERAARFANVYCGQLQQPNGMFRHGKTSPFFWGRGNGWVAAGIAETLRSLPENNPERAQLMDHYRKFMAGLLKHQNDDGMWYQLLDDPESWPETSCTAMFTFAMTVGVNHGWLGEEYAQAARKAWIVLCTEYLDERGNLSQVCQGTGQRDNKQYYLDRGRRTGDLHGQCAMTWCTDALLQR